ncbi:MAG TPA: 3-ketoacyl-ACP reductase [Vicinamibacterales bacterium]|nr:3-ketoacyl-ACP reductase [Vicinamibacterales bacterium]HPW20399.1 3-ketoacyl-ACP reductase [Vicinamibacterales bacterium]
MTISDRPVALVTGAARGIGRASALALGCAGFQVAVNDLGRPDDLARLGSLADELAGIGADSVACPLDIGGLDGHAALFEAVLARWGRIDCVVNNAGVSVRKRGDLLDVEVESFDVNLSINTRAMFFMCQRAAKLMLAQGQIGSQHRSIINVTSCNVETLALSRGEYCVAKAASAMTTRLFALRLAEAGIGVYEIRPGIIETDMTRPVKAGYDARIAEGLVPMRRWGQPEDIASAVVCMATGRLPYTVGQPFNIDGGLTIPHF